MKRQKKDPSLEGGGINNNNSTYAFIILTRREKSRTEILLCSTNAYAFINLAMNQSCNTTRIAMELHKY